MSKTSVRGAQAVTDTSLQKKRPFISVLDQNSMRRLILRPRRDAARYKVRVSGVSGVSNARVRTAEPVPATPVPTNQLFIVMDTSSTNLSGIPMETIQDLMPQAIELALLQLLMQQPGSGPAIRESLWSVVSGEVVHPEPKQLPVSEQPAAQRHKFKVATAAQLREKVLARGEWLSAQEISDNAGYRNANPSVQPNKWKKAGKIFAIAVEGRDLFPSYGLGVDGKPLPQMKEILALLSPHKQPLAIASWFASANSWLGGKTPMDEIAKHPQGVLKAAHMEAAPIEHG